MKLKLIKALNGFPVGTEFETSLSMLDPLLAGHCEIVDLNDTLVTTGVELEIKNDLNNPLPVSGPLTDAQLRATPVPVSDAALIAKFTDATQKTQVVDASGANLYPAGKSAVIEVRLNRPADVIQYTVGDAINSSVSAPVTLDLANFALANGKGAWITGIVVATNLLNLANSTIRLWLYRTTPSSLVGDNVAFTTMDANTAAGRTSIDVTFGSLLTGSDVIIGQVSPMLLMQCDVAHADIQQVIQTLATFTPVSGGFIDFTYTLLQL